jgi:predicted permease
MVFWKRPIAKAHNLFRRERTEQELAREIASHLTLLEDDFRRRGMTPDEARLAARRAYGGVEQAKELHRDERSFLWLEQALQDLRHASRSLAHNPGFTLVAVITLALGIGVNTTLFSAYNAVALKPLPVSDPDRVMRLERWQKSNRGEMQYAFSYLEYLYCRDHNDVVSGLAAASWPVSVLASVSTGEQTDARKIEKLQGQLVSASYFDALGINATLGRTFLPEEDRSPGANPVVVLSFPFWQRAFHGDPRILGRLLRVNDVMFTIIGVAPEKFTGTSVFPQPPDFWTPLSMQAQLVPNHDWLNDPISFQFQILARLKPSIPLKQAQLELSRLLLPYSATFKAPDPTVAITLQHTAFFGNTDDIRFQGLVAALMLIVGMVLLVACANVANMLLARGAARRREIGVRLALGAGRGRLLRHLLTETILLSFMGGIAGLILSIWTTKLLWIEIERIIEQILRTAPGVGPGVTVDISPDGRVLAYALGLAVLTGIVFGLSPALQSIRQDLTTALKDEGTSFGRQVSRSRLRNLLIAAQVAASMLLLTSAGLLARGLVKSQATDPGFNARGLLLMMADFGDDPIKAAALQRRVIDHLRMLPQLRNVAMGYGPMMGTWTAPIVVREPSSSEGVLRGRTLAGYASDGYLDTLGIPLLRGRGFTTREAAMGAPVAVISQATARRFWPTGDSLGKRFQLDMDFHGTLAEFEVIGIAKDIRFANLTRTDPARVYLPTQSTKTYPTLFSVRGDAQNALAAVRTAVQAVNNNLLPGLLLVNMEEGPLKIYRSMARLLALFAAILAFLALSLAAVGIYGVMGYAVSQRTQEIGVRMALGATPGRVLKAVALQGLPPVAAGMIAGLLCGAALSAILHSTLVSPGASDLLYGVRFYDPLTFLGLSAFLAGVATAASVIPARRALKVDPMIALRYE